MDDQVVELRRTYRDLQAIAKLKRTAGWKFLMTDMETHKKALMEAICECEDEKQNVSLRAERRNSTT